MGDFWSDGVRLEVLFVAAPHCPAEPCARHHSAGAHHLPEMPAMEILLSRQGEFVHGVLYHSLLFVQLSVSLIHLLLCIKK